MRGRLSITGGSNSVVTEHNREFRDVADNETTQLRADPLRVLSLPEVVKRSGYGRSTIMHWLALDTIEKTPGKRFPRPFKNPANDRLEWREQLLVEWLDKQQRENAA
jgi:predicted DNA-binding transcriptional regulator AlpA